MTNGSKKIKVVSQNDAKQLAQRGRVTIVGHGEFVTDGGEVIKVSLVKWNTSEV